MKRVLCLLLLTACGHDEGGIDDVVGAACTSDRDCDTRCYMGGDFPGGFCSLPCVTDNDCPSDTLCMSEGGGVCMFTCPPFDCTRLGANWHCSDKSRNGGGNANVCNGD